MQSRIALAALLCLTGAFTFAPNIAAQDPGLPDTVRVDSVGAFTNTGVAVPVYFTNDQTLGGLEVTVTFSSPDIQVDSVSFVGGRLESYSVKGTFAPPGGYSIYCIPFSGEPTIPAGSGLLAQLYLSWDVAILPQFVTIDTITILNVDVEYSTTFSTADAQQFRPQYEPGYLNIEQGFGCCVGIRGNIDGDEDESINITDLSRLIAIMFRGAPPADCPEEANVNGDDSEQPNVTDLTYLIAFLFRGGPEPAPCQ